MSQYEKGKIEQQNVLEIDLLDVCKMLLRKLHVILLSGLLLALVAFVATTVFITPQYESTTKMYVLTRQDDSMISQSDLTTSGYLTKDYAELVLSRPVLEDVIVKLNLNLSLKNLSNRISVDTPDNTRIITITVKHANPITAKRIADTVREASASQIQNIMNVEAVNVVEKASLPTMKSSPGTMKNTAIGGLLGIIIAIAILTIIHISDDTIKTADDVTNYLELSVLGTVGQWKGEEKKSKKSKDRKAKKKHSGKSKKSSKR